MAPILRAIQDAPLPVFCSGRFPKRAPLRQPPGIAILPNGALAYFLPLPLPSPPSLSFHVRAHPGRERGFVECTGGKAQHCLRGIFFAGDQTIAIHFQKQDADNKAGALVSVDEGMVADDTRCIGGSQLYNVGPLAIRVKLLGPREGGLQQPFVAHPRRASVES